MAELGEGLSGYLDVQDATLRAPRLEAVSNIGIANTAPQHAFSVGSNLYVDTESSNVLTVDGNVVCEGVKVGLIEIVPSYDLAAVSNVGNVTQSTIQFANTTTSFVTTANATIGNILTVEGNASINGNLSVTSNLEVGTANLFVDTTNSRVGVGTSIPTESLDVVGNMNLQQVSNTASIKLNSNVVTEFNRSKKLIKYPRVAMSGPSAPTGYVASASRENDGRDAYTAFDGDDTTYWQIVNDPDRYDTSGNATSDATLFEGDNGEWIKILLPDKVKISSIRRRATNSTRRPTNCKLYGSNDNTAWDLLEDITFSNTDWADGNVNTNNYYNYFVLQVLTVSGNGKNVDMKEFELYGTPEYDPEADGVDVVVKSVPNVPNTDWLEVYYDGQDYTQMPATVDNKTGVSTYDATPINGVGFDTEYKAFTFDANSSQYLSSSTPVSGNYTHTISMWFKGTNLTSTDGDILMWVGDNVDNERIEIYVETDLISYNFRNNGYIADTTFQNNRWYHLTCTYNGTQGSAGREIYVDGQRLSASHSGSLADLNITNSTLNVGGYSGTSTTYMFSGSIANFRLFNRALTSDEIWQLYAYQKEYFGHGDLGMTLKAGRLGIGTSEPKAALDVNGTLRVGHDRGASMQTSMVIADGGNVGIGTSNPTSKLHIIDDNADTKVTIRGGGTTVNDSNVTIQLLETAASFYGGMIGYSGTSANQGLRFGHYEVSSTPRIDMAIDRGTGNVGIGTTDPSHAFHVASSFCRFGNIKFNSGFSAMPSDASTGINMIGGNAGGAVLFVMTFHNGANDATATRMVLLRKRQSGTWTQSSTNTTVIAAQTASGTQDGTLSFDTSNNILRYRYSTGGNSHFYVIEFDG
jgi:hypothetical protein